MSAINTTTSSSINHATAHNKTEDELEVMSITSISTDEEDDCFGGVRFHSEAFYFEIEHVDDMPAEQLAELWYQHKEYDAIRQDSKRIIASLCTVNSKPENYDIGRGLEHHFPDGAKRRAGCIRKYVDSVLEVQSQQKKTRSEDPSFIASLCLELSRKPIEIAQSRALKDAECARKVHQQQRQPLGKRAAKRKGVTFSKNVHFRTHIHCLDIEPEEVLMAWYQSDDYAQMKAERKMVAKVLKKRDFQECDDYCKRGVESLFQKEGNRRRMNKFLGVDTVLDEQDRQYLADENSPELIAAAYRRNSIHCEMEARRVGKEDEAAAAVELEDCRKMYGSYLTNDDLANESSELTPPEIHQPVKMHLPTTVPLSPAQLLVKTLSSQPAASGMARKA